MKNSRDGIAAILKRLSAWRLGEDVNLMEFGAGPSVSPGGSSRGLLMLIVMTHAALLGYLLGASLLFNSGGPMHVADLPRGGTDPELRQVSLNKADREPIRLAAMPEPEPLPVSRYARLEPVAEMVPTVALEPVEPQVASSIWPEDQGIQAPQPAAQPIPDSPPHTAPAAPAEEAPAAAPGDAAPPPTLFPHMRGRRPTLDVAEIPPAAPEPATEHAALPVLNPHPPAQQLAPLPIAHVPPQAEERPEFGPQVLRAGRWPEDSGHNESELPVAEAEQAPAEMAMQDRPAASPPPAETSIPAPPQAAPSTTDRLAMAATAPIAESVEPMTMPAERIGDPGIIIDRFFAREELVAMPLPERRGFLPGEVTTQELSASLGPDLTVLKGGNRDKLLDDYRAKVRDHLAGLKPPGGFGSDTVVVGFTLTRKGTVASAKILESRGIYHLEQGTLNAVYGAAPFPKPPRELKGKKFEFAIPFRFE